MRVRFICSVLVGAALAVSGCGPTMYQTKSRLLKDGVAPKVTEDTTVRIAFVPMTEGGPPMDFYAATYNAGDGTFQVAGKDGRGVPPGKYRVTVEFQNAKRKDMLNGAFNAVKSPFVFVIDSSTKELVLDLDKPPTS
jgi:hypothetical protein